MNLNKSSPKSGSLKGSRLMVPKVRSARHKVGKGTPKLSADLKKSEINLVDARVGSTSAFAGQNLLKNVCLLLRFASELRRENSQLRQQVFCLGELFEIEKMKNALFTNSDKTDDGETPQNLATTIASSGPKRQSMEQNIYETLAFTSDSNIPHVPRRQDENVFMELSFPHHPARSSKRFSGFNLESLKTDHSKPSSPSAKSDSHGTGHRFWSKFNLKKFRPPTSPLARISKFGGKTKDEEHSSASDSEVERMQAFSRMQVKKRKRKISDSESFTSSTDASTVRIHPITSEEKAILSPFIDSARNAKPLPLYQYRNRFDAVRAIKQPKTTNLDLAANQTQVQVHVTRAQSDTDLSDQLSASFCSAEHNLAIIETTDNGSSVMTISDDSVFASQEAELNRNSQALLQQVLALQQRNSLLIRQLRDKGDEYDVVTTKLLSLEDEVHSLRSKHCYEAHLQRVCFSVSQPWFVPAVMVCDLEGQMREIDASIKGVKDDLFHFQNVVFQQKVLEGDGRMQANSRQYLDELETLQKEHYVVLKSIKPNLIFDDEVRRLLDMLPSYNALYSFAIRMIKTLKQMRSQLLEKVASLSQTEMELLQTQSALLLAHAFSERQRTELRWHAAKRSTLKRHSWHGQDLAGRLANEDLSFYLPFKLHGSRIRKPKVNRNSDLFGAEDSFPEAELIQLFKAFHSSGARDTPPERPPHPIREASVPVTSTSHFPEERFIPMTPEPIKYRQKDPSIPPRHRFGARPPPIYESVPLAPPALGSRPTSVVDNIREPPGLRFNRGNLMDSAPVLRRPTDHATPSPLPLGNVGQVRAITQVFEASTTSEIMSAPVSPVRTAPPSKILPPARARGRTATPMNSSEEERKTFGFAPKQTYRSKLPSRGPASSKVPTLPRMSEQESSLNSSGSGSLWSITQEKVSKKLFQRRGVTKMPNLAPFPTSTNDFSPEKNGAKISKKPTEQDKGINLRANQNSRLPAPGKVEKRSSWMEKLRHRK